MISIVINLHGGSSVFTKQFLSGGCSIIMCEAVNNEFCVKFDKCKAWEL